MSDVKAEVRRYDDPTDLDSPFEFGVLNHIEDGWAYLDFYDWKERVPVDKLVRWKLFHEGYDVFLVSVVGEVVERFQQGNGGP